MTITNVIIQFLLSLLGELGKTLKVLFQNAIQKELAVALPIAKKMVLEVAADPSILQQEDKRKAAFARVVDELLASHKEVASSTINLAIELAVKALKAEAKL